MDDEIIDELRRVRAELARQANYDIREMARRAARVSEEVRLHAKRVACEAGQDLQTDPPEPHLTVE